ncbi:MAG TPA: glutamate decarboxylase [Pirellulales bacterium]|jgi:glutamate decarboxylase|nr:glutamate decarboxylase [Pirellulales bacterium]
MPLHAKDAVRDRIVDDVYCSRDSSVAVPKYRFPPHSILAEHAYSVVHDELMLDGNARMNLATFCQTWVEPEVHRLMDECLDKNIVDKDEYPQTAEIETRAVHMLADLWNSPAADNSIGCSTTGSSEAAMLAGLALKWRWRERRRAANQSTERPNLVCGPVQVCWHKFARYFDVELREVPMEPGRYLLNPEETLRRVDENTIGVVATLGVTFTCQYEPVGEICHALDDLAARSDLDVPVHVDAASGGFVAPFLEPQLPWDFRLPRVKSINASGHKYGLAPLGCGWVIWRQLADLSNDLIFRVDYLGGDMPTFALNFSRPGGQVMCQYYNFLRFGREGYREVQQACRETASFLADQIGKLGPFGIVHDGRSGLPAACWTLKSGGQQHGFTLYDMADRLRYHGWQVCAYPLPGLPEVIVQRALIRHGVSRDLMRSLVADMRAAIDWFRVHPISVSVPAKDGSGFHH